MSPAPVERVMAKELELPVSTDIPYDILELTKLYPQPVCAERGIPWQEEADHGCRHSVWNMLAHALGVGRLSGGYNKATRTNLSEPTCIGL
jgi:hypothetical protein